MRSLLHPLLFLSMAIAGVSPFVHANEEAIQALREAGGRVRPFEDGWEIELQLAGKKAGDRELARVAALGESALSLNLRDTRITDEGLAHLAELKNLARLHLERTSVGDRGIAHLKGLKKLEYLNLYGTKVTDAGLLHLRSLHQLRDLFLWQTGTTDGGHQALSRALPKLRIVGGVDLDRVAAEAAAREQMAKEIVRKKLPWITEGLDDPPRSKTGEFTTVLIQNTRSDAVKLYWVQYGGGLKFYAEIEAGASLVRNTFSDATWVITDQNDIPLGYFISILDPAEVIIPKS